MHYNIDLVVITTSSVYCDHKKKNNNNKQTDKQTKIKLPNKSKIYEKINKRKETKNKQKQILQGSNFGPLDVESLA